MKLAILGGSFNPIHMGHLALADDVCTSLGYDKMLFVVTNIPPHKEMNCAVSSKDRLEMVKSACECDSRFEAEDCELKREGVSYTYDTVCYLEEKYKGALEGKIGLVMGDDLISGFHLWRNAKELSKKCDLILARRPSAVAESSFNSLSDLSSKKNFSNKPLGEYEKVKDVHITFEQILSDELLKNAITIENPLLSISSTDIRTRIAEGKSFRYLVPSQVFDYISSGKLYGYK
ncbi:MAG: nicotinate (nicotinamide) nucleotide adenylyltransferase [Treponema sp.]